MSEGGDCSADEDDDVDGAGGEVFDEVDDGHMAVAEAGAAAATAAATAAAAAADDGDSDDADEADTDADDHVDDASV